MRKAHIDYLKAMLVTIGFTAGSTGKLLETYPSEDKLKQMIPVAVLQNPRVTNNLDARLKPGNRIARLDPIINGSTKTNQYLKRHFKQEFKYQLDFWLKNPAPEILSEPATPGFVDKAMVHISENQMIPVTLPDVEYNITVDVGASGSITDEADKFIYKYFIEIIFRDGLYSVEQAETLAGATLEILPPVEVEVV
jgi:hypothetical protein